MPIDYTWKSPDSILIADPQMITIVYAYNSDGVRQRYGFKVWDMDGRDLPELDQKGKLYDLRELPGWQEEWGDDLQQDSCQEWLQGLLNTNVITTAWDILE